MHLNHSSNQPFLLFDPLSSPPSFHHLQSSKHMRERKACIIPFFLTSFVILYVCGITARWASYWRKFIIFHSLSNFWLLFWWIYLLIIYDLRLYIVYWFHCMNFQLDGIFGWGDDSLGPCAELFETCSTTIKVESYL